MMNPYPTDSTIESFFKLYIEFLESSHQELLTYQTNIKTAQQRIDIAVLALKSFEDRIGEKLLDIIQKLPKSKCVFCGGEVVDKTPLRLFVEQLQPTSEFERRYLLGYLGSKKMRFCPECQLCGIYQITPNEYTHYSTKKWVKNSQRKPKFVSNIFEKCPFVKAFSETDSPFYWNFSLKNGEYWSLNKNKEELITQLNLG